VLVLYGYHPTEDYAIDVALALDKLNLERVIVKEFVPRKRDYGKFLRENKANWILDLHSESTEGRILPPSEILDTKSLGIISWGWRHDYNALMEKFFREHYNGEEILSYGKAGTIQRIHSGCFLLGLLWYRPLEQSLELVKKLTDYLKGSSP